jgi:hypothetical protein
MAVDSTGASYVAWGVNGTSRYVKYDTNGTLVTTYDRVADASTETFGKYNSKPAVVVLPDDSFFWFQYVNKNSQDYLMGSKWDSSGNVIFKNRTLDVSYMSDSVLASSPNASSNSRKTGTAVGNMYVAFTTSQGKVLKFNSEGSYIGATDSGISAWNDEVVLGTNGESIYAVSADGAGNMQ